MERPQPLRNRAVEILLTCNRIQEHLLQPADLHTYYAYVDMICIYVHFHILTHTFVDACFCFSHAIAYYVLHNKLYP